MESLHEMIEKVAAFPELYLGKSSLERFYAYIGSFLHQNEEANDHCLDGFNDFVSEKYSINSDHNWASIIQFFSTAKPKYLMISKGFIANVDAQQMTP